MWLKKPQKTLPTEPVVYPVGICVKTDKCSYRIGSDGKRYRLITDRIIDSWKFPFVVETTEAALVKYPIAYTKLGFRDGTLLYNFANGKMYLVAGTKARHITSPDVFERLGIKKSDAIAVSDAEFNVMEIGEDIN